MINHPNRSRTRKATTATTATIGHNHDQDYAALLADIQGTFDAAIAGGSPLFRTDAANLWATYLDALPAERQYHMCSACRRFIDAYGSLVVIGEDGVQSPAIWPAAAPDFYAPAIKAMHAAVRRARIVGPFLTKDTVLGLPVTGQWTHFAVRGVKPFRHTLLTPGQAAAAKREDFGTVARALADFSAEVLGEALRVLEADAVNRSEKFVGPVKWLIALHAARAATKDSRIRDNVLWRAIATAPDGYCHPRSSVIGTLLEDIEAGLPFADLQRRFNAKMHPLMYQRPQALPSSGAIAAAEKIVEQMGIAPAFERRFARLDELETIWTPADQPSKAAQSGGVFAHLNPKDADAVRPLDIPPVTMTWEKFARTVLPNVKAMEMLVPSHGSFIGLTSAVNPEAPPILKWDREDRRNPVAWYCYRGGSYASKWGIQAGWRKITAVAPLPTMWGDQPQPHLGEGVVLVIDGAVDNECASLVLFPECLRTELHAVRSVIEAHSRSGHLVGQEQGSACGYDIRKGSRPNATVRTLAGGRWTSYTIDRWD